MIYSLRLGTMVAMFAFTELAFGQSVLPLPEPQFDGDVGRTFQSSEPAPFPQPVRPPEGAPNMVVILLDDVGYGQFSAFGGGVPAPAMEQLAEQGIRYNRFHTAGICSPTRAALLTGRNPHSAGFGLVGELATGYDGYVGAIPRSTATVAEILRQHGYATAMFGKNHNTPVWEAGPAGPFNHWPNAMGFDYFYGFNGWGTSQWQPLVYENTRPVAPSDDPDYHLTTDLADRAIDWVRTIKSTDPERPYLLYFATGATHAPHHAPQAWIERFEGQFDEGWDRYREETFARQKKLGVIPPDAKLTPRPEHIPAWDSLSAEQQRLFARQMEVFAGFGAHTDHEVGRVLEAVREQPDGDNTMVVYIVGDNGASAEGGPVGEINEIAPANGLQVDESTFTSEVVAELGGPKYNNNFPWGWAWAMSTPFQYYKQVISHLGATRNPLIISWPEGIEPDGKVRSQFHHVVDIAPTLLGVAGIEAPVRVNGVAQKPVDGVSMLSSFNDPEAAEQRLTQHFEVFANRAIYHRDWFASAAITTNPSDPARAGLDPDKVTWELYNLAEDFSQANNLAAEKPTELRQLQDLWWAQAGKHGVLPLDWRAGERLVGGDRPNPAAGRNQFVYHPGMVALPEAIAPVLRNRSWTITAKGEFSPENEGMLITQGGMSGGWAFYLQESRLVFDYNYGEYAWYRVVADAPILANVETLEARFSYDGETGKDFGAGGIVSLWADGKKLGEGRLEKTLRGLLSISEGMDVAADYGSPVSDDYPFPYPFKGKLQSVTINLE